MAKDGTVLDRGRGDLGKQGCLLWIEGSSGYWSSTTEGAAVPG